MRSAFSPAGGFAYLPHKSPSVRDERQTAAIPIDLYRTVVGIVALFYFGWLQSQWWAYSAPDGYLDHRLVRKIFWFTRVSLFQPGMGDGLRHLLFFSGWAACLGVLLGWRSRACALWAWLIGTSHLRWIFPVANLNDTSMLMPLLWCALLPTGRTLIWWKRPWDWHSWRQTLVPGGTARVFVANLALAYWVTGLSKWGTAYWRDGVALFVGLQLNIARTQGWWGLQWLPLLKVGNYAAVLVECGLPLLFLLRVGHPLRLLGFLLACGLHGGIMLTIGIEIANVLWIASWIVVLREDLALWFGWARSQALVATQWTTKYAVVVVACIALSMSEGVPGLGDAYGLGFALQWSLGLSMEYHLFDWIDRFNYVVQHQATLNGKPIPAPLPPGLRGFLVQSYLFEMRWMRLPRGEMGEWQRSLRRRIAEHAARLYPEGELLITTRVARVTPDNLDLHRWYEVELLRCRFHEGKVVSEL